MSNSHTDKWETLYCAAEKAFALGNLVEAEGLWLSALELAEDEGASSIRLTTTLENLAETLWFQKKFSCAAPVMRRLLRIYLENYGAGHFHVGIIANNTAMLYHAWGKLQEAEPFYLQAYEIKRRTFGEGHTEVLTLLNNYYGLLQGLSREEEARSLHEYIQQLKESGSRKTTEMHAPSGITGTVGRHSPDIAPAV